jgi:hypothetical protein
VTQWGFECHPLLARLAVSALSSPVGPLAWPPFRAFFECVLARHDPDEERRKARAAELATATTETLTGHYQQGGTNSDVVRSLLGACEQMRIVNPRPRFEPDPSLLRRNELARIVLDLELGRKSDAESEALIAVLRHELVQR